MTEQRRVALVTGASRGIGKATVIRLAETGFDVVVTARTRREGEGVDESDGPAHGRRLPGSIESTAQAVAERGARVLALPLDMLDRSAIDVVVARVLNEWGRIDVAVNNARYFPGSGRALTGLGADVLEDNMRVNAVNPLYLIQRVLPQMIERGAGTIINVTSRAGSENPPRPAGDGSQWGIAYGMSKAALDRIAGVVHAEHFRDGVLAYTVAVSAETERHRLGHAAGNIEVTGPPPSVPAAVIAWLAGGSAQTRALAGRWLDANDLVSVATAR